MKLISQASVLEKLESLYKIYSNNRCTDTLYREGISDGRELAIEYIIEIIKNEEILVDNKFERKIR